VHFENFTIDGGRRFFETPAMIDGAQWIEAAGGFRNHGVHRQLRGAEQVFEEGDGQRGHIAANDQIPGRFGDAQSSEDAAERAAALDHIGDDRIWQIAIPIGRRDDAHIAGGDVDLRCHVLDQRGTVQRQQGLVASHAGTSATRQDVTRARIPCRRPAHEKMIAYVSQRDSHIVVRNKKLYICLIIGFAMLAASPTGSLLAADALSAPPDRKTVVVRADPRTGKLVRSVVMAAPKAATPKSKLPSKEIGDLVDQAARKHDVDPLLVHSIIKVESNYNTNAISSKGAEGLMQLMPPTARMLGVSNSFDPGQNIEAGVKYLKYLQGLYKDDRLALAAYNAGPGAVGKYNQVPPYKETQNYVEQVGKRYDEAKQAEQKAAAADTAPVPAPIIEEKHPKLENFVDQNGRLFLRTTQ
jgi:soluble lytic murein transglycosylase-like protein